MRSSELREENIVEFTVNLMSGLCRTSSVTTGTTSLILSTLSIHAIIKSFNIQSVVTINIGSTNLLKDSSKRN